MGTEVTYVRGAQQWLVGAGPTPLYHPMAPAGEIEQPSLVFLRLRCG